MLFTPVLTQLPPQRNRYAANQLQSSAKLPSFDNLQEEKEEKYSMAILHDQDQQFFNRLLEKEASVTPGDSGRCNYRAAGAVPFEWEAEPGKPKDPFEEQDLPPLSLPPVRRANLPKKPSSTSSAVPHSPRSLTGKMKSLLSSKFLSSQRMECHENPMGLHSDHDNPQFDSISSFRLGLKKSFSARSELVGEDKRFGFTSEKNYGSKSQVLRGGNKFSMLKRKVKDKKSLSSDQDCSPRSTLEYISNRSSSSSSPFFHSPLTSYASFNRDLPSLPPCSAVDSGYGSNAPGSTVARAILANWSLSLDAYADPDPPTPFNFPFPAVNSTTCNSQSGPQPYCGSSSRNKSYSGPQPRTSRSNYTAPQRMYSGQTKFFSGPQNSLMDPQKSFSSKNHLAMQDPTCSALDQLFPLKRVESSLLKQVQQRSRSIKGNANIKDMENGGVERPAEMVHDDDDANVSAFSPVASSFAFAHYNDSLASNRHFSNTDTLQPEQQFSSKGSLSSPGIIPMHLQTATGAQHELDRKVPICNGASATAVSSSKLFGGSSHSLEIIPMRVPATAAHNQSADEPSSSSSSASSSSSSKEGDLKGSSIGSFSSPEISSLHRNTEQTFVQPDVVARVGSQKISGVLLRQVAQVEKELHNERHKSKALSVMGPSCLPICTFFGRSVLCRSKVGSQRHFLEYEA